ncbi:MAG: hypothetical protein HY370_04450 [Proteobacteria bacterium]|nr:hypothetical protein [Pseudomonadota bacterium]
MKKIFFIAVFMLTFSNLSYADANAEDFVTRLTQDNVRSFLEEAKAISTARSPERTPEDISAWLNRHLAPKGNFRSMTKFALPGLPVKEVEMKLDKQSFIESVLGGQNLFENYQTSVEIKEMKIASSGRAVTLKTRSTEKGDLPWTDGEGKSELIPVEGFSDCAQKIVISPANYIQMADADCRTEISFAPFAGKPLGE